MSSYRSYGGPTPTGPPRDVESTIREIDQDFCTAFNTGNYDACAALYASDGCFMAPHHELVQGQAAIERVLQKFADFGYENLRLEPIRIESSGDMAIEIGRYTVSIRQANGTTILDRGKYLNAWRRFGAWLKLADCWSSDLPPMTQVNLQNEGADTHSVKITSSDIQRSA
jgi:ketosteroid isomerase-like protein